MIIKKIWRQIDCDLFQESIGPQGEGGKQALYSQPSQASLS